MPGVGCDSPTKKKKTNNLTKIEKTEGNKSQNQENLTKLPQCCLQMGQK